MVIVRAELAGQSGDSEGRIRQLDSGNGEDRIRQLDRAAIVRAELDSWTEWQ